MHKIKHSALFAAFVAGLAYAPLSFSMISVSTQKAPEAVQTPVVEESVFTEVSSSPTVAVVPTAATATPAAAVTPVAKPAMTEAQNVPVVRVAEPAPAVAVVAVAPMVAMAPAQVAPMTTPMVSMPEATAMIAAVEPVPAPVPQKTWTIVPGDLRLSNTLERWAKEAGMKLVWDAQKHVIVSTSDSFTGSFTDALTRVLSSPAIRKSSYPLEACIYPNSPPVVRITRLGEQIDDCPQ